MLFPDVAVSQMQLQEPATVERHLNTVTRKICFYNFLCHFRPDAV